ncbi:DUF3300 domain-containing protein [Silvibacterium dinghuense]|uniref:DUF3300 domain-containing protein n=1 Tax=Silvibacterium dinghuense TaxID=1560006 RepID=A0A4Q1S9J4_9BACT|nr:DUF3300 domain-containing protein [Silvibacterium dinghuense]RXS93736.1 DUF3300 domain-containing protein [Silvibacterium dinghuense]GGH07233.1 hypothetical protein GCM10011586_24380 [Silvibacterium dinghuense]
MNTTPQTHDSAARNLWSFGQKAIAGALVYLMIPMGVADMWAQEAPPPPPPDQATAQPYDQGPQQGTPPQAYNALSPDQLDQLVAPIALYPDALVAQILAASTYPSQVVEADRFVQTHPNYPPDQLGQMVDGMNWDPSVKALIAFPSVLSNLDRNLDWTSQLGNAYYNQPQDVMASVQAMRQRAYQTGSLRSNEQIAVEYQPSEIVIAPANPAVVYVPYYNPWVVYGGPVVAWPGYYVAAPPVGVAIGVGLAIGFGIGIAIGGWNHWGWGWHSWGCGWGAHTIVYQRNVYVSRSVTVINHGYYGHFDRAPGARAYNASMASRAAAFHGGANGFNRGGVNNFNRGGATGFNRGGAADFNRGGAASNFNRGGAQSFNRGNTAQGFNRGATGAQNFNRGTTGAQNFNRGNAGSAARPAGNAARPSGGAQRPAASASHAGGGGHPSGHPSGGGHPHNR